MPVVNKPNSMALLPQPEPSTARQREGQIDPSHQRQPRSLQGLLRFAVEATTAEDALLNSEFHPMDEEVCICYNMLDNMQYLSFTFFFVEEAVFGKSS